MFELDQWRTHPVVTVRVHGIEHGAHGAADRGCFLRQCVGEAFGQEIVGLNC